MEQLLMCCYHLYLFSVQVISSMRILMTDDSNDDDSSSFLLDDNSRSKTKPLSFFTENSKNYCSY